MPLTPALYAELYAAYQQFFAGPYEVRHECELRIDPKTGEFQRIGTNAPPVSYPWRFAGYTNIGSLYAPGEGVLFVSLDIGQDPGHALTVNASDKFVEYHNRHHNGMRAQTAHLLSETKSAYCRFLDEVRDLPINARKIWNYWDAPGRRESEPLRRVAVTNFYKFVTIGRDRRSGAQDRTHRLDPPHGGPEKRFLVEQIRILRPKHLVFHSMRLPGHLRWPEKIRREFLGLVRRGEREAPMRVWRSYHPAYRRLRSASDLFEHTKPWNAADGLQRR